MTTEPPPLFEPVVQAPPPPSPSLGGLRELLVFLLSALALFLFVQFSPLYVLAWRAAQESPGRQWAELLREVSDRHQGNAFLVVPIQAISYGLLLILLYALVC